MVPLGLLGVDEHAEILEIRSAGRGAGCTCARSSSAEVPGRGGWERIEDLGVRAGKNVLVLRNEGTGPVLLKIDEARIAVARAMAMRILVRRTQK